MPNKVTDADIISVIEKFNAKITEFEIIDLEELKGWSSEHLFLIVAQDENYILKAKTQEQITGYDNEISVTNKLLEKGVVTRRSVLTLENNAFFEGFGYFWCLMTYIPGAPAHIEEYDKTTVKSLAEHIDQYVKASLLDQNLQHIDIHEIPHQNHTETLENFMSEITYMTDRNIINTDNLDAVYQSLINGSRAMLENQNLKSIIHNDINPRNILIDHKTKNVISLIDWDHVKYGNPLKDVSDAVAIFYDFLDVDKANDYKNIFYKSILSEWFTNLKVETIEFAFFYYYTVSKWRAVLFYMELLKKYGNQYGEEKRFINEIKHNFDKWTNIINTISL